MDISSKKSNKYRLFLLLIFAFTIWTVESAKVSESPAQKSDKKLKRLWQKGGQGAAELHDGNYTSHALSAPRDFPIVLLFTARNPNYGCEVCDNVENQFQMVARAYLQQPESKRVGSNRIAFATLDVDSAMSVFNANMFNTVPHLFILPPIPDNVRSVGKTIPPEYEIDVGSFSPVNFAELLKRLYNVQIPKPRKDPAWAIVVGGVVAVAWGLIGHFVCLDNQKARFFLWNRRLWYFLCLFCYGFGVSGMVFCIIRNPPPFYHRPGNNIELISGEGRGQYVYEGVMIGLANALGGLALVGSCNILSQRCSWWTIVPRMAISSFLLAVFLFSMQFTYAIYTTKTQWYSAAKTLPDDFQFWLASSVKKTSGWAKRIIRISEYFLFEYKTVEALKTKFNVVIINYAVRFPAIMSDYLKKSFMNLKKVNFQSLFKVLKIKL